MFRLIKTTKYNHARLGVLKTSHGDIRSPFFMPIATKGGIKSVESEEMEKLGANVLLANTYHLFIRPGLRAIKKFGGLHKFMKWDKPILTDSGGFQVFSLSKIREILPQGVKFQSHLDGKEYLLTPKLTIKIQQTLGADIMMVLDECIGYPAKREYVERSVELTTKWAKEGLMASGKWQIANSHKKKRSFATYHLLFAIVQGGIYKDLRLKSMRDLINLDFDGYAIGGLAVGEPAQKRWQVVDWVVPELPENKPRYLMGVGQPEEILEAVVRGIDMFDCVLPTRNARHGSVYVDLSLAEVKKRIKSKVQNPKFKSPPEAPACRQDRDPPSAENPKSKIQKSNNPTIQQSNRPTSPTNNLYKVVHIKNKKYALDKKVLDSNCDCLTCKGGYSRAYLRHLFLSEDPLAQRLLTLHNVRFYLRLMEAIRKNI